MAIESHAMLRFLIVSLSLLAAVSLHPAAQAHELPEGMEFLGEARLPWALDFQGTRVGGLSALLYDPASGAFLVLSDGKGEYAPPRFYTMRISLAGSHLEGPRLAPDGVTVIAVTLLRDGEGKPYPEGVLDPEGLALRYPKKGAEDGEPILWLTSEGTARTGVPPQILAFTPRGNLRDELALPPEILPLENRTRGVRPNAALESLTLSPDGRFLYTAVENALWQDGPMATPTNGTRVRILRYDLEAGGAPRQFFYLTEPVTIPPVPADGFSNNGLVELLALPEDRSSDDCAEPLLALERAYSVGYAPGRGNTVRLYRICLPEEPTAEPLAKTLFLDLAVLGGHVDNIEAMALGPTLPDGRRTLILVSDDNFDDSRGQVTQFLALTLP